MMVHVTTSLDEGAVWMRSFWRFDIYSRRVYFEFALPPWDFNSTLIQKIM